MMSEVRIGVISDTHGYIDEAIKEVFQDVDHIVHAGDIGSPDVLEELKGVAPVTAVRGNIDGGELRFLPLEAMVSFNGVDVALLHIAGSPKRPRKAARELIARLRPDVLIVGHSHVPVVGRVSGTLWINPGAAGRQGFHLERTAAILRISEKGEIGLDRVLLGPRSRQG